MQQSLGETRMADLKNIGWLDGTFFFLSWSSIWGWTLKHPTRNTLCSFCKGYLIVVMLASLWPDVSNVSLDPHVQLWKWSPRSHNSFKLESIPNKGTPLSLEKTLHSFLFVWWFLELMDLQNQMGKLQQDSGFKQTFFFYLQALLKRFSQLFKCMPWMAK